MDKEEILEKSRKASEDEGTENALNKGLSWGVIVMAVAFALITVLCMIFSRNNLAPSYAASTMFWGFLSAHYIPQYKFTKKITMLIGIIGFGIAGICSLLSLIITVVR